MKTTALLLLAAFVTVGCASGARTQFDCRSYLTDIPPETRFDTPEHLWPYPVKVALAAYRACESRQAYPVVAVPASVTLAIPMVTTCTTDAFLGITRCYSH